jgi:hypothetical protein
VSLAGKLEETQLPRRLLGATLSVLVPGAGHIVLGYTTLGWVVAGVTLVIGAIIVAAALTCSMTLLAVFGAIYILGTIASALSIFALRPGPRITAGLRALWPVLALFVVFRGAAYGAQRWGIEGDYMPDSTMEPRIIPGDLLVSHVTKDVAVGDLVVVEPSEEHRYVRRVTNIDGETLSLAADHEDPKAEKLLSVSRSAVRAKPLFVFATARGTNGVGRVWKPLQGTR